MSDGVEPLGGVQTSGVVGGAGGAHESGMSDGVEPLGGVQTSGVVGGAGGAHESGISDGVEPLDGVQTSGGVSSETLVASSTSVVSSATLVASSGTFVEGWPASGCSSAGGGVMPVEEFCSLDCSLAFQTSSSGAAWSAGGVPLSATAVPA
ncbi:MAG: hypothetical protein M3214_09315 [Actinomycetota bacterium]|nr:hypothetical protein [Actinomycetota bacterium]